MKINSPVSFSFIAIFTTLCFIIGSIGCANIIPPGGGPRDSLPPVLVSAVPGDSALNFTGNRITLNFDEYVEVQNQFENVIVSPTPTNAPLINNHFRVVTIKMRDSLEPNTTYSINFGNGLRDINEGNIAKNFTYVFATGNHIDENTISGKVIMAETGRIDSTLIVVLHRNLNDTAVLKDKPRYVAKLDGKGAFQFRNLPAGAFAIYALPNDYSKRYEDSTKPFAFASNPISAGDDKPVTLYAFTVPKVDTTSKTATKADNSGGSKKEKEDKTLRVQTDLESGRQDLLKAMTVTFSKKITAYDSAKITLTDTNYRRITGSTVRRDTTGLSFIISNSWLPGTAYNLVIDKSGFSDSAGATLRRSDTLHFLTKRLEDYGSIKLRFRNINLTKNPVLQVVLNDKIIESAPLTTNEWYHKLFIPGDYELRILYDDNKNGVWDTGSFFREKKQPEIVITLNTKINVKANWDNEKDITL